MARNELFHHCVKVLNEYNHKQSEKTFLEEYFRSNKVSDQSFVSTVLVDCVRHVALLKIITETFYKTDGVNARKSDENIYTVITYIIFFQLDTVGLKCFREMIDSVQLSQIYEFLQFLLNETHLSTVRIKCLELYEEDYVNEKIVRVIQAYLPDLRSILHDLTNKIKQRPSSEPMRPKPFNLTIPKPRTIPVQKLTQNVEKRRLLESKNTLKDSRGRTRSSEKSKKEVKIIDENEKTLIFNRFRANPPPPKSQTNKIPVKLNLTTVLKENQFYRKQEDEIHRRLNNFEAGGRDANEFLQWQQTMQKQDYEQELSSIERKKLEGKISYEEAILAKQRLVDENRQIAEELKRQTRQTIEIHVKEKLQQEEKMKQLIEEVVHGRDNAKSAQQKLRQYKTDFVKQYKEEIKQLMKQTLEEAELEMRQRVELIQQIRAMESIPVDRSKPIDLTSTAGHGLHDEMSISELRERLELLKFDRQKERESRRDQIGKEKQIKEKLIMNTVQQIAKYRNESTTQTTIKRQQQRNTSAPAAINKTNSELHQMNTHLQSKQTQRLSKQQQSSSSSSVRPTSFKSPPNECHRSDQSDKTSKRLAPSLLS